MIFPALGLEIRAGHFYFGSLKRQGKPSENKSHTEQPERAYTAWPPGKGQCNSTQGRTPKNQVQQAPPPEDQLEEQVNGMFMDLAGLQNSSAKGK